MLQPRLVGMYGRLINHSRLHANLLPKVKSTSKAKVKSPFRKTLALRSSLDRKKYNIPNSTFKIVTKIDMKIATSAGTKRIYNPITAMGFPAMFTFQLFAGTPLL